jgi:hypothetical protein
MLVANVLNFQYYELERFAEQRGWLIKVPGKSRRIYLNFVVYESMSELMEIAYKESSFSIMNFDWFCILRFETSGNEDCKGDDGLYRLVDYLSMLL